jgi:hypothetical protein
MGICGSSVAWLLVFFWALLPVAAQEQFSGVDRDYVPEGKPKMQRRISTVWRKCQAVCSTDALCKAYAFRTVKSTCYFYAEVFMGGAAKTRRLGLYSAGLAIMPKPGFISGFKRSSFPPPPIPLDPQK